MTNANELTELVQNMLTQMQNRFKGMSENIVMHIDEMGNRIEDLEKSIGELVNEAASIDDQPVGPAAQAKNTSEDKAWAEDTVQIIRASLREWKRPLECKPR